MAGPRGRGSYSAAVSGLAEWYAEVGKARPVNFQWKQIMSNRYPYVTEFLQHIHKRNQAAKNTIESYEDDLKRFFEWLLTNYGYNDPTKLTKAHILKFRDYMEESGYAPNTIGRQFAALSQYIGYLCNQNIFTDDTDPWPKRLNLRSTSSPLPHVVPTPAEIFRIRMRPRVRLEHAWFFELGLSSGMRSDEMAQLVPADFNFNDRPYDKELCRPSPYFTGSIQLAPTKMTIKRRRPRKVYFSYLAGMLTKEFLAKHGLDASDRTTCIMPWHRTNCQQWIRHLGEGIIDQYNPDAAGTGLAAGEVQRDRYYSKLNVDELNVDPAFKRLISRRQKVGEGLEDYKREAAKQLKVRQRHLHPHSMRHAFTSIMYYRNPLGERQADSSLRILLGHQQYNTTFIYLRDLPLVQNDTTWKQLWLGKPHDWSGINR
jgi:site-specific recombinase XerD